MTGLIVTTTISLLKPDDFDWEVTRAINALPVSEGVEQTGDSTPSRPSSPSSHEKSENNLAPLSPILSSATTVPETPHPSTADSPSSLNSAFKLACISSFTLTLILDFILPMPMFFSHYVFSKGFFTAWVVISFVWVFVSAGISCFLPVWETRGFWGELWGKMRGRGKGSVS